MYRYTKAQEKGKNNCVWPFNFNRRRVQKPIARDLNLWKKSDTKTIHRVLYFQVSANWIYFVCTPTASGKPFAPSQGMKIIQLKKKREGGVITRTLLKNLVKYPKILVCTLRDQNLSNEHLPTWDLFGSIGTKFPFPGNPCMQSSHIS